MQALKIASAEHGPLTGPEALQEERGPLAEYPQAYTTNNSKAIGTMNREFELVHGKLEALEEKRFMAYAGLQRRDLSYSRNRQLFAELSNLEDDITRAMGKCRDSIRWLSTMPDLRFWRAIEGQLAALQTGLQRLTKRLTSLLQMGQLLWMRQLQDDMERLQRKLAERGIPIYSEKDIDRTQMTKLGQGGMCGIRLVRGPHGEPLVEKVTIEKEAAGLGRSGLLLEALVLAHVDSPHVVALRGVLLAEDRKSVAAIYMDRAESDLASYLKERPETRRPTNRQVSPAFLADMLLQLSRGLDDIRAAGYAHRDIKLENVLVFRGEDGRPILRLADLGIAASILPDGIIDHGLSCGTELYMAPELDENPLATTAAVDIFALGTAAYCVWRWNIRTQNAKIEADGGPQLSRAMVELIVEMRADDPEDRPSLDRIQQVAAAHLAHERQLAATATAEAREGRLGAETAVEWDGEELDFERYESEEEEEELEEGEEEEGEEGEEEIEYESGVEYDSGDEEEEVEYESGDDEEEEEEVECGSGDEEQESECEYECGEEDGRDEDASEFDEEEAECVGEEAHGADATADIDAADDEAADDLICRQDGSSSSSSPLQDQELSRDLEAGLSSGSSSPAPRSTHCSAASLDCRAVRSPAAPQDSEKPRSPGPAVFNINVDARALDHAASPGPLREVSGPIPLSAAASATGSSPRGTPALCKSPTASSCLPSEPPSCPAAPELAAEHGGPNSQQASSEPESCESTLAVPQGSPSPGVLTLPQARGGPAPPVSAHESCCSSQPRGMVRRWWEVTQDVLFTAHEVAQVLAYRVWALPAVW